MSRHAATGTGALPADPDLRRRAEDVERLAWWLDEAIRLPGGFRIGLDGLIGLIPGIGDAAGLCASGYILLTARRLGVPRRVLARMTWNVLVESVVGVVPLAGDLFDFAWKANSRNIGLLRQHVAATQSPLTNVAADVPGGTRLG